MKLPDLVQALQQQEVTVELSEEMDGERFSLTVTTVRRPGYKAIVEFDRPTSGQLVAYLDVFPEQAASLVQGSGHSGLSHRLPLIADNADNPPAVAQWIVQCFLDAF